MGILIDTDVWVHAEKSEKLGTVLDFSPWHKYGGVFISAVTASELLVGVERASTAERRVKRSAFVERILRNFPVLEFGLDVARTHAHLLATLAKEKAAGVQDSQIAATALHHGHAVLTGNTAGYVIFGGLVVETWPAPVPKSPKN